MESLIIGKEWQLTKIIVGTGRSTVGSVTTFTEAKKERSPSAFRIAPECDYRVTAG